MESRVNVVLLLPRTYTHTTPGNQQVMRTDSPIYGQMILPPPFKTLKDMLRHEPAVARPLTDVEARCDP